MRLVIASKKFFTLFSSSKRLWACVCSSLSSDWDSLGWCVRSIFSIDILRFDFFSWWLRFRLKICFIFRSISLLQREREREESDRQMESKTSLNKRICWFMWICFSHFFKVYVFLSVFASNSQKSILHCRRIQTKVVLLWQNSKPFENKQILHLFMKFICDRPMNMKSKCVWYVVSINIFIYFHTHLSLSPNEILWTPTTTVATALPPSP